MKTGTNLRARMMRLITAGMLLASLAGCGGAGRGNGGNGPTPPPSQGASETLYVGTISGGVAAFSVDANTGALTQVSGSPFTAGTAAAHLAVDQANKVLYATSAVAGPDNLHAFTVNPSTGALSAPVPSFSGSVPGQIALDPAGKNAYVIPDSSANQGIISAFSIAPNTHVLTPLPNQPTFVAGAPQGIALDPSGQFLYMSFTGTPGIEIAGRLRDPNTGALSFLPQSPFGNPNGDDPRGILVTPSGSFVVVANFKTNNVSVLNLTPGTGVLNNIGGSPFPSGGTGPVAVAIDPSAKFVFVANQTSNNLSVFSMNTANGGLAPVAGSPFATGTGPVWVTLDPAGKFVYVSDTAGMITAYALNTGTGALTPVSGSPFSVGTGLTNIVFAHP